MSSRRRFAPTPRWTAVEWIPEQRRLINSQARFRVTYAGRRSGKTEIPKRLMVSRAVTRPHRRIVVGAPTHRQTKEIYWSDLKLMSPPGLVRDISETERVITYATGSRIILCGMDQPQRAEGSHIDDLFLDEYADMKEDVWAAHLRPALSTPGREPGEAWFYGTPDGLNHFRDLVDDAARPENRAEWDVFHWTSADVLALTEEGRRELDSARRSLDPRLYRQEYEADFLGAAGRAYYEFDRATHASTMCEYDPDRPLLLAFDFNVDPGVALILQEQPYRFGQPGRMNPHVEPWVTVVLDEVHKPGDSRTPWVCQDILARWGHHKGQVYCYGDASGGARGSAKTSGSDWEQVRAILGQKWPSLSFEVPKRNPAERARVNAVNARLRNADQEVQLIVNPACAHTITDLERVCVKKGGGGEIDKDTDKSLTHLSDALGYYIVREFPIDSRIMRSEQVS